MQRSSAVALVGASCLVESVAADAGDRFKIWVPISCALAAAVFVSIVLFLLYHFFVRQLVETRLGRGGGPYPNAYQPQGAGGGYNSQPGGGGYPSPAIRTGGGYPSPAIRSGEVYQTKSGQPSVSFSEPGIGHHSSMSSYSAGPVPMPDVPVLAAEPGAANRLSGVSTFSAQQQTTTVGYSTGAYVGSSV